MENCTLLSAGNWSGVRKTKLMKGVRPACIDRKVTVCCLARSGTESAQMDDKNRIVNNNSALENFIESLPDDRAASCTPLLFFKHRALVSAYDSNNRWRH
jgi:hypothetical protein